MKKTNFYIIVLAGTLGALGVTTLATKLTATDSTTPARAAESVAENSAMTVPVKAVYDHYLKIQAGLAGDSLTGVTENAEAMAKAVQTDAKILPIDIGTQAEVLVKASDLSSARAAFKPLSGALIKYLADHQATGIYVQVYCPMARASWLQADKNVNNPYFGSAMSGCGEIQN